MTDILAELAFLYGKPTTKAKIKVKPEHFIVRENLGFEFTGTGEHLMVRIRKTGENTSFVANELAKVCAVKSKDVGWAGLKDRHAVTEQWLSIHLPKSESPDFTSFEKQYPSIQILETTRHNRKLRPGDLIGNDFEITLSEVTDVEDVEFRIKKIIESGVPNYFGAQRFGKDGNNLLEARRWGKDNVRTRNQNKRSLYLSTARSWLFNHIVSARLNNEAFSHLMLGDIVTKSGDTIIINEENLVQYQGELESGSVNLTAALAGDNDLPTKESALELEQAIIDSEPHLMALIRGNRMRHDRRDIVLKPLDLKYKAVDNRIVLSFSLSSGSFATSIVRELIEEIPVERHFDEG